MSLDSTKQYCWQDQPEVRALSARRRSFGAWAMVLTCRRRKLKEGDDLTEQLFDNIRSTIDPHLELHGEPPRAFVRCWLLDRVDTYAWLSMHHSSAAGRANAAREVAVARIMWRRYVIPDTQDLAA